MAQDTASPTDKMEFSIIVYLPTGRTTQVTAKGTDKLAVVRDQCQKINGRFRLYSTLYYFDDSETISDLVAVYPCFEGLGSVRRYSIMIESPNDLGDEQMRKDMKADAKKPLLWQGYLLKCSKPTGKGFWQKRYFVVQSNTLFWYNNQEAFLKGQKAQKFLQVGGIIPSIDNPVCQSTKQKNPMALDIPPHYGHSKGTYILASESEHLRGTFIETLSKIAYFRQCVTVLATLPHIRPFVEEEGIFRLAGNSTKIQQLQQSIDFGIMPDFEKIVKSGNPEDLHTMTGLFKRNLRFMQPPVVPTSLYENFIQIGRLLDVSERVERLQVLILQLPYRSLYIMSKLFPFLKFAAKRAAKSRMDAENLAIVIGPNVLRTNVDNPLKAMDDNDHIKAVMCTMIQYCDTIFPSPSILLDIDKQSPNFNDGLANKDNGQGQHGRDISFGGGIFDITNKITSNASALGAYEASKKDKRKSAGNLKFGLGGFKKKKNKNSEAIASSMSPPPSFSNTNNNNNSNSYSNNNNNNNNNAPFGNYNSNSSTASSAFGGGGGGAAGIQAPAQFSDSSHQYAMPQQKQGQMATQTRPVSRSVQSGQIVPTLSDLDAGRLRKTSKDTGTNNSNNNDGGGGDSQSVQVNANVDFRSKLKKSTKFEEIENSKKKDFGNHTVDFRAHLKKTPKKDEKGQFPFENNMSNTSNVSNSSEMSSEHISKQHSQTVPPMVLKQQLNESKEQNETESKADEKKKQLAAISPLSPPPPPSHVVDDYKRQQENDQVSSVCQDFQDRMGEIDEEIDFLQDYAQELFSHIMEMADQGSIENAQTVAKRVEQNCDNVIKAAQMQRDALTEFNKYLEKFLNSVNTHVTPGGPDMGDDGDNYQDNDENEEKNDYGHINHQISMRDGALDSFSAGLPMNPNASNNNDNYTMKSKANEEKKEDGVIGLPKFGDDQHAIASSPSDVNFGDNSQVIKKEATNVANEGYSAAQSPSALYVVKASYDYPGGYRTQELTFSRGNVLLVTAEAQGWLFGCYESDISRYGWFPESYVHKM